MPFEPPTQEAVIQRVQADFRVEAGVNPLRRSLEYALLYALAGQSKGLYSFLVFIFRQCFPTTADGQYFWRWASLWGINQKPAGAWQGLYRFTGTDTTPIPIGTELSRSDGQTYLTDAAAVVGSTTPGLVDVAITAVTAGATANNADTDPLILSTPIVNVDSEGVVQSTTITGTDVEDPEDGLVRLLQRLQAPPSGGKATDYIRWALEVTGVTRAWAYSSTPGSVFVQFVRDDDGSGADILPSPSERDEVETYVQAQAPITTTVAVTPLSALLTGITITDLVPDTTAVRDAITESLEDYFFRLGAPGGTLFLSQLDEAISNATGETSHTLVSPAANVVATIDEMPIFDGLTVT